VHLAVLRGTEVLYLEKVFGHSTIPSGTTIGSRKPAYCTALGKAILAFSDADTVRAVLSVKMQRFTPYTLTRPDQLLARLQRVRAEGVAVDCEEWQLGVTCLAAPLLDPVTGRPVGALSISSATTRGDVRRLAPRLRRVAATLSGRLVTPVAI